MMYPIVLGNGELHVNINQHGQVDGFHFPHTGLHNHMSGRDTQHHIGVWVDGTISWLTHNAADWSITSSYPYRALIGATKVINKKLGILLEFSDAVDGEQPLFLRNIHVVNMRDTPREVRLFMHQAFTMDDLQTGADTITYVPSERALLHYRGSRAFMIGGQAEGAPSFDQYSVGLFGAPGQEGTFRDADDGELSMNQSAVGKVDSTVRFSLSIPAHDSRHVQYWIAAGNTHNEAKKVHRIAQEQGVHSRVQRTLKWWHEWIHPVSPVVERIDEDFQHSFIKSLLYIKSHIDTNGAIVSAANGDDGQAYCRPYEAAISLWPLIRLGYQQEPRQFFAFCQDILATSGSLCAIMQADGTPGPRTTSGVDLNETAIVLFMFSQLQQAHPQSTVLADFYDSLVKPLARTLVAAIDAHTALPKAATPLWGDEEVVSTHTTAVVYAALQAGSELAEAANDADSAVAWRLAAVDMHTAAQKALYNTDVKTIQSHMNDTTTIDTAGVFGSFMFGLFGAEGVEVTASVDAVAQKAAAQHTLGVQQQYPSRNQSYSTVATLWLAQYYVEKGMADRAKDILTWVQMAASATDMLPAFIDESDTTSEQPLSLWAHAEYVSTLLDMIAQPKDE